MAQIKKTDDSATVDYMARDYDSLLSSMRAMIPAKLPEWKEYESDADFGNVLLQLFAHMGDILSYYQDRVANESFLGTAQTRRSIIHHLKLIGYKLATAAPASTNLTLLVTEDRTDVITINKGDAFATKSQKDKPSVRFEYTGEDPLIINCVALPKYQEPVTKKIYKIYGQLPAAGWKEVLPPQPPLPEGIPVEEGRLVKDEILGKSDGTPNQQFTLAHPRLILRATEEGLSTSKDIELVTQLGEPPDKWALQDTLAFSRMGRQDFTIEIDERDRATVIFGDGAFGAIPGTGAVIKATYRVGGGLQGNCAANTITTIVNAPQLALLGAKVTNPVPSTGGAERESIENAVLCAPTVFRSLKRAVTAKDYEALALRYPGVGKVRAVAAGWNTVQLFVAPEGGGRVSDVLKKDLLAYFEDKRPISTIIEIEDVDYVTIFVSAKLGVKSYFITKDVQEQVRQAVKSLFTFDEVNFGQTIYLSKLYERIEEIEGVDYVTITEFRSQGGAARQAETKGKNELALGKIELGPNEIPILPADYLYFGGLRALGQGIKWIIGPKALPADAIKYAARLRLLPTEHLKYIKGLKLGQPEDES